MNEQMSRLNKLISEANSICFFGGAGVSVPSGIPDFRSAQGIFSKNKQMMYAPEEIVSHHFFIQNPQAFYQFYFDKMVYLQAKPNATHTYLSVLENKKNVTIVTQNIDGLHQLAGSKKVIELHGSIHRNTCMKCHKIYELSEIITQSLPKCDCGGIIKPDVVLYEEQLNQKDIESAIKAIAKADLLIVGGTSLSVYPAAGLIQYFGGKQIVVINIDKETKVSFNEDVFYINEDIDQVFMQLTK